MEEKNLQPEELKNEILQEETKSETTENKAAAEEETSEVKEDTTEESEPDGKDEEKELPEVEEIAEDTTEESEPDGKDEEKELPEVEEIAEDTTEESEDDAKNEEKELTKTEEVKEAEKVEVSDDYYSKYSREQLVEELELLVQADDINTVKTKVGLVKMAYLKLTREEAEEETETKAEEGEGEVSDKDTANSVVEETVSEVQNPSETEEDTVANGEETEADKEAEEPVRDEKKAQDILRARYNTAFRTYKKKREQYLIQLEEQKVKNLEAKRQILQQLKEVINSEDPLKKSYDEFKSLQEKWREIGMVPKSEVNNLWQSYHFHVEMFFDKVKINNELRDLDLKKNLEKKIQLCESADELLLETSIIKSFKKLQELHQEWKETGPVPSDKKDELWDRFKNITDKINNRRREHYTQLREEQDNNYNAKLALCEQVEALVSVEVKGIKEWNTKTDSINELLKMWKSIGPAPKVKNDEIWARFKGNLDIFFEKKKEFFNKLKDQQINNYNLKLDLCNQAESIKDSDDWKETTRALIDMQKKWKSLGPVPKKYSDKIWKRFRAACDEFFNRKEEFFGNIHEHEADNLAKKRELIERVKSQEFGDKKDENLSILKGFQREWMNIGHVPIKEKDAVQQDFRKAIDEKLEKLQINEMEINTMNFKSRVENMKESGDANRALYRERMQLSNKVTKLNDDINLWENNIGFLAESKNANLLKHEFEKKIQRAKQDVALLNAKLNYLNEQM